MKKWPDRPKGLTERGYRKYMAKQKEVVVNGNKFMLQSVSPRWYFDLNDRCGMTGGKRKTAEYIDELFKNVVIDPKEVSTKGFDYFEEAEDILTPESIKASGILDSCFFNRKDFLFRVGPDGSRGVLRSTRGVPQFQTIHK